MPTLCLILARAGSKGLPRKNALTLGHQPLIGWTLDHALASSSIDRVVVSTDGDELARIAQGRGVEVVRRDEDLANDAAPVDAAARHAAAELEQRHHETYDAVVILYGNVPVRPADLTDRAVTRLRDSGADSVQSVSPVGKHHPYWMKTLGGLGGDRLDPYYANTVYRRQDLPPVFGLNGGIIAVTRASLFTQAPGQPHAFLGKDRRAFVTGADEVIDIDTELDLRIAEAVLRHRGQLKVSGEVPRAAFPGAT